MTSHVPRAAARFLTIALCVCVTAMANAAEPARKVAVGEPFPRLEGDL